MGVRWEELTMEGLPFVEGYRSHVPGGWLVLVIQAGSPGVTFLPDPEHLWDGAADGLGGDLEQKPLHVLDFAD